MVNDPGAEGLYDVVVGRADSLLLRARMSDTLRGYVMIEKGVALYNWGRILEAVAFADTMVRYGSRIGFSPAVVQGEQLRGGGLRRMEKYDSAFAAYSRAMEIVVREKDSENERVLAELLAITCRQLGRSTEAGGYARKAMDLAVQMEDTVAMFSAVSILGSVMAGDGQYSETIRLLTPYTGIADSFPQSGQIKLYTPLLATGRNSAEENAAAIREIASRVRRLSHELMPPGFAEVTFVASLRDMAAKYSASRPDVRITVTRTGSFSWDSLDAESSHELYRMVQECLANALKHSRPTSVDVLLSGDRTFRLLVVNDGIGPNGDGDDGIGLRTLKARADIIHASVSVVRDGKRGTFSIEITQND